MTNDEESGEDYGEELDNIDDDDDEGSEVDSEVGFLAHMNAC